MCGPCLAVPLQLGDERRTLLAGKSPFDHGGWRRGWLRLTIAGQEDRAADDRRPTRLAANSVPSSRRMAISRRSSSQDPQAVCVGPVSRRGAVAHLRAAVEEHLAADLVRVTHRGVHADEVASALVMFDHSLAGGLLRRVAQLPLTPGCADRDAVSTRSTVAECLIRAERCLRNRYFQDEHSSVADLVSFETIGPISDLIEACRKPRALLA